MTDQTLGPDYDVQICFFRKLEVDLPVCKPGDVVLIRDIKFTPSSYGRDSFLSAHKTKAAVFTVDDVIQGTAKPPRNMQLSEQEQDYIQSLAHWSRQQIKTTDLVVPSTMSSSAPRSVTELRQLKPDSFYRICGEVVRAYTESAHETATLYISDYTQNEFFHHYDEKDVGKGDDYSIPLGKKTLQVTLWEPHRSWAIDNTLQGKFVELDNVHIKYSEYGSGTQLEGKLHTDYVYSDKLCIRHCRDEKQRQRIIKARELYNTALERLQVSKMPDEDGQAPKSTKLKQKAKKEKKKLEREQAEARLKEMEAVGGLEVSNIMEFNTKSKLKRVLR
jgi:ssDNA-binding domain of telomere protection protein